MTGSTVFWYLSRATGVVTLLLFTAVLVLGLMVTRKGRLPGLPGFAVTSLHRNLSLLGLAFVVVHVLTAVLDGYVRIRLPSAVIPFTSGYELFWLGLGAVALDLIIAIILVVLVVFAFLRNGRATLIPSVAVPVSLIGTFGVMYLLGYSLDNLSLMALTISTGFVVDDAIVVLENITRHIEAGMTRMDAALLGSREVGFTVLSMSLSLIAVFVPILLMGGIVGRLFREFAMTLSVAILISLVVSLTTTPMMCAYLLARPRDQQHGALYRASERVFTTTLNLYERSLRRALRWPSLVMLSLLATLCLGFYLVAMVPKGFFPNQDIGLMIGGIQADQSISFQLMEKKLNQLVGIIEHDPAVQNVNAFTGGGQTNSGFVFVVLKPLAQRHVSMCRRSAANVST